MSDQRRWQCPHCQMWSLLDSNNQEVERVEIAGNAQNLSNITIDTVVCRNEDCRKATITAHLIGMLPYNTRAGRGTKLGLVRSYPIVPASHAKPQPAYIPSQIVADYEEAHLISALSPKASATLSGRCLQGMIRDFFGINGKTLFAEINAIKDKTQPEVWEAVDAVRKIGNIGAHMEKDINVILDVDEGEALLLLQLIEQLFEEWYVARHDRQERLQAIAMVAAKKDGERASPTLDDATQLLSRAPETGVYP